MEMGVQKRKSTSAAANENGWLRVRLSKAPENIVIA